MTFDFTTKIATGIAIPAQPAATDKLPFKAMFSAMVDAMTKAKAKDAHSFIPLDYWVKDRKVPAEKATHSYGRAKLREQFNQWVKADEPARKQYDISLHNRSGKEADFAEKEPGLSVWVIDKTKA